MNPADTLAPVALGALLLLGVVLLLAELVAARRRAARRRRQARRWAYLQGTRTHGGHVTVLGPIPGTPPQ